MKFHNVSTILLALFLSQEQGSLAFAPSTTTQVTPSSKHSKSSIKYQSVCCNAVRDKFTALSSTVSASGNESNPDAMTIQILMSDTGGGHRASANALRDALQTLHGDKIECDIVDIYTEYGPFWPLNSYPAIYKFMAEYSFLWKAFYEFGATPFGLILNEFLLETFCFDSFKECLSRDHFNKGRRADMVVSVHPLTQEIPLKILNFLDSNGKSRDSGRTTPFVTVVTDLGGAHPTWFNSGVDKCFVPSDALYQCAIERNVKPEQIVQHGLPIRRGFWGENLPDVTNIISDSPKSGNSNIFADIFGRFSKEKDNKKILLNDESNIKNSMRSKLSLEVDTLTALVVGGGDGMGGIISTAQCLGDQLSKKSSEIQRYQMVVVCGNNKDAKETLSSYEWGENISVNVQGFVNNMDEWMRASDVIVTKAGPGTIAEASICGLPCLLSSYLPGQEEGNVPYVEDNNFGTYCGDPNEIASTVVSWLNEPEMLSKMQASALKAARPSATIDIAKDLADILFESVINRR